MAEVKRAAIILLAYAAGENINLRPAEWYVQYFFNPEYGQAAYWLKQTDNQIALDGEVLDWIFPADHVSFAKRVDTLKLAVELHEARGTDFSSFDVVIVTLGVPPSVSSDGGSARVNSTNRSHHGIVARTGDRFDFVAHELGHAIGLQHSFGDPTFVTEGDKPGGYGHPYCIMSAMSYGGKGGPFLTSSPRDGAPEYNALGPSLNAGAALARGWVDAQTYQVGAAPTEIVLRSRHHGGRDGGRPPQALNIVAPDGSNYVVEFREDEGWDKGQKGPVLIVVQDRGGIAEDAYPDAHSSTFVALKRFPLALGPGVNFVGPGFRLQILDRSFADHTVRFRVMSGAVSVPELTLTQGVKTVGRDLLESGETTWAAGEKLCVEGTWPYERFDQTQEAQLEVGYALSPAIATVWSIDGTPLGDNSGTVELTADGVIAQQKLDPVNTRSTVAIGYEIIPLPHGSRIKLTNRPQDETYHVAVRAELHTTVGKGQGEALIGFEGRVYQYPPEFYRRRDECVATFENVGTKFSEYKHLMKHELWQQIAVDRRDRVTRLLDALSHYRGRADQKEYELGLAELKAVTGIADLQLEVVQRGRFRRNPPARLSDDRIDEVIPPPSPAPVTEYE
jgi:hypothetical protein